MLILWKHPNLLVLDEVTTHLDYRTVVAVSDALSEFNGAILLVTHDRFLVRRVIEGERSETDEQGMDEDEEPEEVRRERTVYLLDKGRLLPQSDGVRDFERRMERQVVKLSV